MLLLSPNTLVLSISFSKNLKINIYKTILLPFVLYGCDTWSLTLSAESKLRVFENKTLRRVFGPTRDENGGGDGSTSRKLIVYTIPLIGSG